MPCYYPLTGWRSRRRSAKGKRTIVFNKSEGFEDQPVSVPCNMCIGCRLEYSRQWAIRCVHESKMHEHNQFITLTYNDENLPLVNGEPTLRKIDFQLFMKRLRKKYGEGIKFYAGGEYGEQTKRPHYHACLFGLAIPDKVLAGRSATGNEYYTSADLESIWGKGFVTIGEVTFESAAYVARYCMKKVKGKEWRKSYERVNLETGEIYSIEPEFALMSRRPGIGKNWLEEYKQEVKNNDAVIINGKPIKPPKYYDTQIEKDDVEKYEKIKAARREAAKKALYNNSLARLHVRGEVKKQQTKVLKKGL